MVFIISRFATIRVLIAATMVVFACGGRAPQKTESNPTPSASPPVAAVRIVFLGDSLSAGMGLAEADAFPALVGVALREDGHAVEVVNAGVSGDTSAGGLARIDWVLKQKPDVLVVELGGNDALRGQPIENTEENIRQIVRRGLDSGARLLLLGMDVPTNYGFDYGSAFAELYERVAEEEGVTLVPGFVREVGADPTLLQPDGLHPTAEGHRRLAEILIPYLEEALTESTGENSGPSPRGASDGEPGA